MTYHQIWRRSHPRSLLPARTAGTAIWLGLGRISRCSSAFHLFPPPATTSIVFIATAWAQCQTILMSKEEPLMQSSSKSEKRIKPSVSSAMSLRRNSVVRATCAAEKSRGLVEGLLMSQSKKYALWRNGRRRWDMKWATCITDGLIHSSSDLLERYAYFPGSVTGTLSTSKGS